ncbi:hypothetical protein DFH06DRAFT_1137446 [Mycena polygramma]|nr:hypothetical protein DFH06DRAFT_1137446 [Mycena polygramma]
MGNLYSFSGSWFLRLALREKIKENTVVVTIDEACNTKRLHSTSEQGATTVSSRISNRGKETINISQPAKASRGPIAMSACWLIGCTRRRAWRRLTRTAMKIVPRQCAAMEDIDAGTTRGDAAMWCWVAAVVPCDAARRGAKAADAAN